MDPDEPGTRLDRHGDDKEKTMNRGLIGTIIGVLVIIVLVIVILQLT